MKKKTNTKKVQITEVIEDLPEFKESNEEPCNNSDSNINELNEIISSGRNAVYDVIYEMMAITMEEAFHCMVTCGITEEYLKRNNGFVSNIHTNVLASLLAEAKNGPLKKYVLGKSKASLLLQFLDIRTLTKESMRAEYGKAFEKWTGEEELLLAKMYNEGFSWKEIAACLQRNVNAVKIRAEKLSIAENTGAKRRF